jgi:hypothetical protein
MGVRAGWPGEEPDGEQGEKQRVFQWGRAMIFGRRGGYAALAILSAVLVTVTVLLAAPAWSQGTQTKKDSEHTGETTKQNSTQAKGKTSSPERTSEVTTGKGSAQEKSKAPEHTGGTTTEKTSPQPQSKTSEEDPLKGHNVTVQNSNHDNVVKGDTLTVSGDYEVSSDASVTLKDGKNQVTFDHKNADIKSKDDGSLSMKVTGKPNKNLSAHGLKVLKSTGVKPKSQGRPKDQRKDHHKGRNNNRFNDNRFNDNRFNNQYNDQYGNTGTGLIDMLRQLLALTNGNNSGTASNQYGQYGNNSGTANNQYGNNGTASNQYTNSNGTTGNQYNRNAGGSGAVASAGPGGAFASAGGTTAPAGRNQYGSGGNQYSAGSNQYGTGGNQYGTGGSQYGSGGNQYGAGSDQYGAGSDQYSRGARSSGSGIDNQDPVSGPQGDVLDTINTDGPLPNTGGPLPNAGGLPVRAEGSIGVLVIPFGIALVVAGFAAWRFGTRRGEHPGGR